MQNLLFLEDNERSCRQIQFGNFTLANDSYEELKRDYLALAVTVVDIVN